MSTRDIPQQLAQTSLAEKPEQKPFPFLKLPQELRDKVYEAMLEVKPFRPRRDLANRSGARWYPLRWRVVGMYRPVQYEINPGARTLVPFDNGAINDDPAIWSVDQIGDECKALYIRKKIVAEIDTSSCATAFERWVEGLAPFDVATIQQMQVILDAKWTREGHFIGRHDLDEPLFCLKIIDEGAELVIHARCKLRDDQESLVGQMVRYWAALLDKGHRFDGRDLVDVVLLLRKLGGRERNHSGWPCRHLQWVLVAEDADVAISTRTCPVDVSLKHGFRHTVVRVSAPSENNEEEPVLEGDQDEAIADCPQSVK